MEDQLLIQFLEANGGKADLLKPIKSNQIDIGRLCDISRRVPSEGTSLVVAHYGTLTNAVAGEPAPTAEIMKEAIHIIHKGLKKLKEEISVHGDEVEKFSPESFMALRRSLSVHAYLSFKALGEVEGKSVGETLNRSSSFSGAGAKTKKKVGKAKNFDFDSDTWRGKRSMLLEDLASLLDCPVEKIWEETAGGFSFSRCLIRGMCSTINDPFLAKEHLKFGGPEAFKILGILASRFKEEEAIMERLVLLVKIGEDVAKLIARAVETMVLEYHLEKAVPMALKSIEEMCFNQQQKNAVAEKGYAALITDLCELTPADVAIKASTSLIDLLESDSSVIRSAVLTGSSALVSWLSSPEGLAHSGKMLRNAFIERILLLHTRDLNGLVRNKALNLLTKLIANDELKPTEVALCMENLKPRILDRTVTTRKNAAAMLMAILEKFPMIVQDDKSIREEVDKMRKKLLELLSKNSPRKSHYIYGLVKEFLDQVHHYPISLPKEYEPLEDMDALRKLITKLVGEEKYWDACIALYHCFDKFGSEAGIGGVAETMANPTVYISYFHLSAEVDSQSQSELNSSYSLSQSMSQDANEEDNYQDADEVIAQKQKLLYFQGCEKMAQTLPGVINNVAQLLDAGTSQDKTEMINLVASLVQCGYVVNDKITESVVAAISEVGKDVAGDILPAFWSIFIGDKDIGNLPLIKKLFSILETVHSSVKDQLKPIISEMYKANKLDKHTIMILWDAFTKRNECWTDEHSKHAVFVLGILGQCDKAVITQNLQLLIDVGLGPRGIEDMGLAKYTCEAILFTFKKSKKGESDLLETTRFESDHEMFDKLIKLLELGLIRVGNPTVDVMFPKVAELSIQIIYKLCWKPSDCIQKLLTFLPVVFDEKFPVASGIKNTERIFIRYLSIMCALLGSHINYHEAVVLPELRRRKQLILKKNPKATISLSRQSSRSVLNTTGNSIASTASTANRSANQSNTEMDVMIGSAGYDNEQEYIRTYIEKLLDSGTFRQFRTQTLYFCRRIAHHKSLRLKLLCVQALAKLMSVSSESVSKHVETLVNLWTISNNAFVKIEIVKQCAALNVRFPNQMETCNAVIQSGLNDPDVNVKMACLDFMSYLALGDLVKVRDHISDVALCLCDPAADIRDMAKDFFNVCAEKDNLISNAVPEVISKLSKKDSLSQNAFQNIMKFLLVRVKKEKQILGLVEKLVARFRGPASGGGRLWQDTAFCIAQLPLPEKSLKILKENISNYADKLADEAVFISFATIIETMRKVQKDELRLKLDDYEKELEELHEKCIENQRIENAANRQGGEEDHGNDSSLMEGQKDTEDEDEDMPNEGNRTSRPSAAVSTKSSSDEEVDNDIKAPDVRPTRSRRGR